MKQKKKKAIQTIGLSVIKFRIRKSGKVGAGIPLTKDLNSYIKLKEKLQKMDNTVKNMDFFQHCDK